jgi:hypothetical protein
MHNSFGMFTLYLHHLESSPDSLCVRQGSQVCQVVGVSLYIRGVIPQFNVTGIVSMRFYPYINKGTS